MKPEIALGKDALLQPQDDLQAVKYDPKLTDRGPEPGGGGGIINLLLKIMKFLFN